MTTKTNRHGRRSPGVIATLECCREERFGTTLSRILQFGGSAQAVASLRRQGHIGDRHVANETLIELTRSGCDLADAIA